MANLRVAGSKVLKSYIPELYAPRMLKHFYENSILSAIFNTDYQGEFTKMGETIHIRKPATVEVRSWKEGDHVVYPEVGADDIEMTIDHGSIWSFKVGLLTKAQVDNNMADFTSQWTQDASKQTQKYTETLCIAKILGDTLAVGNHGATAGVDSGMYNLGTLDNPVIITSTATGDNKQNALDYIADHLSVLEEQNATGDGEAVSFIGPKIYGNRLKKSDEFKYADKNGGTPSFKLGQKSIGSVFGADFYSTGYLRPVKNTNGKTVFPVIACTKRAASFALQFTHTWDSELEGEVAHGFRGTTAFGCKLIEPRALTVGYVAFN